MNEEANERWEEMASNGTTKCARGEVDETGSEKRAQEVAICKQIQLA